MCIFEPTSFADTSEPSDDNSALFEIVTKSLPVKVISYVKY
jgi:hypothetical protein